MDQTGWLFRMRLNKLMVKRSLRIVLYSLLGLVFVQYAIAFGYPHYTEGEKFCRIQPVQDENSPLWYYDRRAYDLRVLDDYLSMSTLRAIRIALGNGNKRSGLPYNEIYFGYSDGQELYGWSFKKFSYYHVPTGNGLYDDGQVIESCQKLLDAEASK